MKAGALILAAGRGERMRPLTDHTPKPLLQVHGKPLIVWHIEALAKAGVRDIVINTAWLEDQFPATLGDGSRWGVRITYSHEGRDFGGALETAGGICRALPLLGDTFWLVAGDIYLPASVFAEDVATQFVASDKLAQLWLVPNPPHNPRGDFGLAADGTALSRAETQYTYSTIGLYRKALFAPPFCDIPAGNPHGVKAPLAPILRAAMDNNQITASLHTGAWTDVGTPERLAQLNTP
ncbi:MAG: nucleotidyltransferase family protein [Pseudomonadota bacterium]